MTKLKASRQIRKRIGEMVTQRDRESNRHMQQKRDGVAGVWVGVGAPSFNVYFLSIHNLIFEFIVQVKYN